MSWRYDGDRVTDTRCEGTRMEIMTAFRAVLGYAKVPYWLRVAGGLRATKVLHCTPWPHAAVPTDDTFLSPQGNDARNRRSCRPRPGLAWRPT